MTNNVATTVGNYRLKNIMKLLSNTMKVEVSFKKQKRILSKLHRHASCKRPDLRDVNEGILLTYLSFNPSALASIEPTVNRAICQSVRYPAQIIGATK